MGGQIWSHQSTHDELKVVNLASSYCADRKLGNPTIKKFREPAFLRGEYHMYNFSCSPSTNFDAGMKSFNEKDYRSSHNYFIKCFEENKTPLCASNAGVAAQNMGDMNAAKSWYTLAARYGEANAISILTKLGWAVPAADLSQQQQPQPRQQSNASNSDAVNNALIGIGLEMMRGGAPQQAPAQNINAQICAYDQWGNKTSCFLDMQSCILFVRTGQGGQCH